VNDLYRSFIEFINEYTTFFEYVVTKEEEKYRAMISYDLEKIEHALSEHQSIIKKVEIYEQKREKIQKEMGYENLTLKELMEKLMKDSEELVSLYRRFKMSIENAKYYNEKSLNFAKENLEFMEELNPVGVTDPSLYNAKGNTIENKIKSSMLNKKI
jgi:flagellar biosynthesis/type III secretory pathway chaperone